MTDKPALGLPEWPVMPQVPCSIEVGAAYYVAQIAALTARMEALMPYADHTADCGSWRFDEDAGIFVDDDKCTCGLTGLLAACDRSSAAAGHGDTVARPGGEG